MEPEDEGGGGAAPDLGVAALLDLWQRGGWLPSWAAALFGLHLIYI